MLYLVAITWLYVALMMAVAEAISSQGTVLGAIFTFLLYGLGPVALMMYLLGTPARRRARRQRELQERDQAIAAAMTSPPISSSNPDGGGHAAGDAVPSKRKEP